MNILAIGAHPDDIELGCAGTMLRYARAGHQVFYLIMSDGGKGGDISMRRQEQESAAQKVGVKKLFWGNASDTRFSVDSEMISFIESVCAEVRPDEVYVNYGDDSHQDHRALAKCVMAATRYVGRVLFYEDYTSINFQPEIFIDISSVIDDKIAVVGCHRSQLDRQHPNRLDMIESVKAVAHFRGFQGKVTYAEGFKPLRYLKFIQ